MQFTSAIKIVLLGIMSCLVACGPDYGIVGHDEFIIETEKNKAEKTLEAVLNCMSEAPDWIVDIPLAAEGKVVARYEK